jgi:hypothetical protein
MNVIFSLKTHRLSPGSSAEVPPSRSLREWSWPSNSPCKWVLSCSSLSVEEKVVLNLYHVHFKIFKSFWYLHLYLSNEIRSASVSGPGVRILQAYWDTTLKLLEPEGHTCYCIN